MASYYAGNRQINEEMMMRFHESIHYNPITSLFMDCLSDSSAERDNPDSADLQRLHAAWRNVKQKKQSDRKSVGSVKNAIHLEQQKNLEARLAMTEKQLSKARENTALLMKKLSEAQEEIQLREFEYGKQKKLREERDQEIEELKLLLSKQSREDTFGLNKQNVAANERELEALSRKVDFKEKEVDRLCLKIKSLELDRLNFTNEVKNLRDINDNLRRQLTESQNAINEAYLGDHSKGTQILELEEATKVIERLVLLLRATEEYRLLGEFAEEVKDLHFLKQIPKRLKSNGLNHRIPDRRKMCSCMEVKIDERLLWTPEAAYKTMLNMKLKYDSLNEECIEQVLFQLNKIWLGREQARVRRVKETYESELSKQRKKNQIRYDELVARKQIQRLKKELTGAKNSKKSMKGVTMDSLKNVGQYEDQVRIRDKEIKLLQERVRLLETETSSSDRALYLEGALWIIEKVLGELNDNDEDLREFQVHFRERINGNLSTEDWLRSFKQFFQAITEINNSLVERLFTMRDSTLRKVSGERPALDISRK